MSDAPQDAPGDISRPCPRYAFTPFRFIGLSAGSGVAAIAIFAIGSRHIDPTIATITAIIVAWLGERLTYFREPGFVTQWVSAVVPRPFCWLIAKGWRAAGAMPPPNFQDTYEP